MATRTVEWRVVGMSGRPASSNTYSEALLGDDARKKVINVQAGRGGRIERREIIVEDWRPVDPEIWP